MSATVQLLGVPLICTSADECDPLADRALPAVPIVAAQLVRGSVPNAVVEIAGKPSQFLADFVIQNLGLDRTRTIMIGDRLDSDMIFGRKAGVATALVATGAHNETDVLALKSDDAQERPDYLLVPGIAIMGGEEGAGGGSDNGHAQL